MPTNAKDFIQDPVTLATGTWEEVVAAHDGIYAEIRQTPGETQQVIKCRHRTAADANTESIAAGEKLTKRYARGLERPTFKGIRAGDTLGFFQASSGTPTLQVKIYEE